jgi:hypothetical protein
MKKKKKKKNRKKKRKRKRKKNRKKKRKRKRKKKKRNQSLYRLHYPALAKKKISPSHKQNLATFLEPLWC